MGNPLRAWLVLALCVPLLAGCPQPFGDPVCGWRPVAAAYIDANGNGTRDPGEAPLEGVRVAAEHVFNADRNGKSSTYYFATSSEGTPLNSTGVGYCPDLIRASAQVPAGYIFTTANRAELRQGDEGVVFGLRQDPTRSGLPPAPLGEMTCYGGPALAGDVNGVALTPEGDLWTSRVSKEQMFSLVRGGEHTYAQAPGLSEAFDVTASVDGMVWAGGGINGGVVRYDGHAWKQFTQVSGLPGDDAFQLEEIGGRLWAITWDGPAVFDPGAEGWTAKPALKDAFRVMQGRDGALWFAGTKTLYRVSPDAPGVIAETREVAAGATDGLLVDAVSTWDGDLWMAVDIKAARSLLRYSPATEQWTHYSFESTGGAMPADEIRTLQALPDGSIFLSGQSDAPFRFVPGPAGQPKSGVWMNYRGQREATQLANLQPLADLSLALQLVRVRSEDGRWRLCKVW